MKALLKFIFAPLVLFSIISCEKDITVDLPAAEPRLVVEGVIEAGRPPYLILSRSAGYFEPTDSSSIERLSVKNAIVTVNNGDTTVPLQILSPSFPVYFTFKMFGEEGKTYTLNIKVDGKEYTATATIPKSVPLNKTWFELQNNDSLGYVWAELSEPAGLGHAYRWFAQRQGKDDRFLPPFGSSFEDKFIDGKTFNFWYTRGMEPNSTAPEDTGITRGYYKIGDTIIVKFCTIDHQAFKFYRSFETEVGNSGNPFAAPSSVYTNIKGGALGIWAGQSAYFDTVIAKK